MSGSVLVAGVCAALAVVLAVPGGGVVRGPGAPERTTSGAAASRDLVSGWWWLWTASAALGPVAVVGGATGAVLGAAAGVGVAMVTRRAEPAEARRARERMRRELPALVELLGAALAAGAPVGRALGAVIAALPGAASGELAGVQARLQVGLDPVRVWGRLSTHPSLAPLATVMARAHESGASVTAAVADLGDELAARERAAVEDRARTVGVRAAVPLGLCLLPSFLLLGIVPLVAAAVDGIDW